MKTAGATLPQDRTFGLVFAGLSGIAAAWSWHKTGLHGRTSLLLAAAVFFFGAAVTFPAILRPLNLAWYWLGRLLGRVMGPVVLGVLYFAVLTPLAILFRRCGRDELRLKPRPAESYWVAREQTPPPESFKHQF